MYGNYELDVRTRCTEMEIESHSMNIRPVQKNSVSIWVQANLARANRIRANLTQANLAQ
jgi:uncharacterized protein YjbI with pentapeptide repeats